MDETNRGLLEKVVENRLNAALQSNADSEEGKTKFKEAMDAVSKQIELDKLDASRQAELERVKMEHEKNLREEQTKTEEAKKDRMVQVGTFIGGLLLAPVIEVACKKGYAKMLCEFEKDYTFTTSAGRALSGLFRFKK